MKSFDDVECLTIDDGNADHTIKVTKEFGAEHINILFNCPVTRDWQRVLWQGFDYCINNGADVIVNADDIPKLVDPILSENAELVIRARPIEYTEHFSLLKKKLQKLGS